MAPLAPASPPEPPVAPAKPPAPTDAPPEPAREPLAPPAELPEAPPRLLPPELSPALPPASVPAEPPVEVGAESVERPPQAAAKRPRMEALRLSHTRESSHDSERGAWAAGGTEFCARRTRGIKLRLLCTIRHWSAEVEHRFASRNRICDAAVRLGNHTREARDGGQSGP
jgi:hypothetical protein